MYTSEKVKNAELKKLMNQCLSADVNNELHVPPTSPTQTQAITKYTTNPGANVTC